MFVFEYPAEPHQRKHGPQGYADYESYRPWLRDEFSFRCVYCLRREVWTIRRGNFVVEHILPQKWYPLHEFDYDNLLYACQSCNAAKRDRLVPDPLSVLVASDVQVDENGTLFTKSPAAQHLVRKLGLNGPEFCEFRRLMIDILGLAKRVDPDLFSRLMSLPSDLPHLATLRPPGGNSRPFGIAQSYWTQQYI